MSKPTKIVTMIGSKSNLINKELNGTVSVHILIILLNINSNFSLKFLLLIQAVLSN